MILKQSYQKRQLAKFLLPLIFCLTLLTPGRAQNPDSSVVFVAKFLNHEVQDYTIIRTAYQLKGTDTTALDRMWIKARVQVVDSTADGYIMNWTFSDYQVSTPHWTLKQLTEKATPVSVRYRTTQHGVFGEFLQDIEKLDCFNAALPSVLEPFSRRKDTLAKEEVARIYDWIDNTESLFLRSILLFHQVHGLGYDLGDVVPVPTIMVQDRYSSFVVPATTYKKLVSIDRVNGVASLTMATVPDQKVAGYNRSFVQTQTGGMTMELNTGWPLWCFEQKEVTSGKTILGELIEIQY